MGDSEARVLGSQMGHLRSHSQPAALPGDTELRSWEVSWIVGGPGCSLLLWGFPWAREWETTQRAWLYLGVGLRFPQGMVLLSKNLKWTHELQGCLRG